MKRARFEIIHAKDGWRWRLISANGRILATGEAHTRRGDAKRAIRTVREAAKDAQVPERLLPIGKIDLSGVLDGSRVQ